MTTMAPSERSAADATAAPAISPPLRRLLVATGGSQASDGALRAARALAEGHGAEVEVLTVYEPRYPPPVPPAGGAAPTLACEAPERPLALALGQRVDAQCRALLGGASRRPARLEVGHPAPLIARLAREVGADLIVVGLGPETPAHRMMGDMVAARLAMLTEVPVLAVAGDGTAPARRALVAAHDAAADARGGALVRAVLAEGGSVSTVTDQDELVAEAERGSADLVAVTVSGGTFEVRVLANGLAIALLTSARCSVLVVPSPGQDGSP